MYLVNSFGGNGRKAHDVKPSGHTYKEQCKEKSPKKGKGEYIIESTYREIIRKRGRRWEICVSFAFLVDAVSINLITGFGLTTQPGFTRMSTTMDTLKSSAKRLIEASISRTISLMNIRKSSGPPIDP
ncbi:hypothetical protein MAR_019062 [Mya arenaria]|uniref:Uncharacterized protein n=1 Tax=Mya arenaria TaxID=6604 RepID=A0ABY7EIZ3_MYAAR|nr:hypothetical protein MAR_019062 [Mya arenaria]